MHNHQITSLHSPHVERVKALLHSRGKKVRRETGEFVVDSYQAISRALVSSDKKFPVIVALYLTENGRNKLATDGIAIPEELDCFEVTTSVIEEMSEVENSQGLLAICTHQTTPLEVLLAKGFHIAYFWQLQDPGNAGTVIRSADASGFTSVLFSPESVDLYSPKVVRSTVGSLWDVPILPNVELDELLSKAREKGYKVIALDAKAKIDITMAPQNEKLLLIFGNEARGLPKLPEDVVLMGIPMKGGAESFNVASAATISMYEVGLRKA
jgi:RNA methyltransferase, TrmH family